MILAKRPGRYDENGNIFYISVTPTQYRYEYAAFDNVLLNTQASELSKVQNVSRYQKWQKSTQETKNRFFVKKSKVHFFDEKLQKMGPESQTSIFRQKIRISLFRLKMTKIDSGGQKSILVRKRNFTFSSKNDKKCAPLVRNQFRVKKLKLHFSTRSYKKSTLHCGLLLYFDLIIFLKNESKKLKSTLSNETLFVSLYNH